MISLLSVTLTGDRTLGDTDKMSFPSVSFLVVVADFAAGFGEVGKKVTVVSVLTVRELMIA